MTAAGRRVAKHVGHLPRNNPESEDRYRLLAELSPDGHVVHRQGKVVYLNAAALTMLGYESDDVVVGRPITDFVAAESQPAMMARIADLATSGRASQPAELALLCQDGHRLSVETIAVPTRWLGEPAYQVILRDLSQQRATAAAETRFEIGFDQSAIGCIIADLDGRPTRVNAAVCAFLGQPAELLLGQMWSEFTHPDDPPLGLAVQSRVKEGYDTFDDDRRFIRPDGVVVWASCHIALVRNEMGEAEYFFGQFQDITERKRVEQELAHQSLHDGLTGLPNRMLLTDRLAHGLAGSRRRGSELGVIFIDLDDFKLVNDLFGHTAGDSVLQRTAERIANAIRPADTVARFGGDEFVVVCDEVAVLEMERIAERVLQAVREPHHFNDQEVTVTSSVGIAVADEFATPESLLRDSDAAMYRAKDRGGGRIEVYDEVLRVKVKRALATTSALRRALERDEFLVHYQPLVDLFTGAIVGAEALLRWNHPERGLVSPDEFISLAEDTGLIVPIGAWVLEQACRQLIEWQRIIPSMSVAVNFSVRQLMDQQVVEVVDSVLKRTGVRPASLCLELTESMFMEDVDYFGRTLSRLKALGVQLSIDDFGTGYSSLSYLKRFPVDAVKVDRAFVDGLGTDPHDTALVAAILAMAEALELEVTAEGVETEGQLSHLKRLHCQRAQGYFLARPMPAAAMRETLTEPHHWQTAPAPRVSAPR